MTRKLLTLLPVFFFGIYCLSAQQSNYNKNVFHPNSFVPPLYNEIELGAVSPKGWLLDQLKIMQTGTTGHLDEVYDKLKIDNGWLGGQGDGWEETPYWLDGAVPLAYLLNDEILKKKVLKYINWTIEHQRPSGYFGPITKAEREKKIVINSLNADQGEDWWPKMVMLKALQQYYTTSHDERVIHFMTKYFHYQLKTLNYVPLGKWSAWASSRGSENILLVQWLYKLTKESSLLKLAGILENQSYSWSNMLGSRDWVIDAATNQNSKDWMTRHGVNVGMGLKSPALNYQRTHDKVFLAKLKKGFNDLMTLHGLPMGVFSADEDLHGNLPTQGAELCSIVESMFSLEQIIGITGDPYYMDALERMSLNALPAQTSDDYNNKQYFQVANQVVISRGVFDFSLPFGRGMNNVLGMRSGYTCCLANMHQGWTKYSQHLWYKTPENGIAAFIYAPNQLKTEVGKNKTKCIVDENTDYPFSDEIILNITLDNHAEFPLQLRVPSWCTHATVKLNGVEIPISKMQRIITIKRIWSNNDKVVLKFPMTVRTSNWGRNSRTIERGPLVFALQLDEKWIKGNEQHEGDYFSVYPNSTWNYGLLEKIIKDPVNNLKVEEKPLPNEKFIWNQYHSPITITASGRQLPNWKLVDGVAHQPVTDREGLYKGLVSDSIFQFKLIPYGFTKVRVVAFPVVK